MTLACRNCGHTGLGLVASLVPGEYVCGRVRGCERRQKAAARGNEFGAWGTSDKWPRRVDAKRPAETTGDPA